MFFCIGCVQKKQQNVEIKAAQVNYAPPLVTRLSQLADSNQPKIVLLDTMPPPVVTTVTKTALPNNSNEGAQKPFTDMNANPLVAGAKGKGFFTNYTTDEGLSLDQVYCSYRDKWGNLWFGTNGGGISKYDGKNFTTYTTSNGLASNVVWCITQDYQDNIWFGTDGSGASKYDGESFTTYTKAQGLPDDVIFSIAEDNQHNLWFGTLNGGASRYSGTSFTNFSVAEGLANKGVKNILKDSKGNLWLGTLGGGVSKYDGKSFTNFTTKDGLAEDSVWSIAEDKNGDLWFGTETKGVSRYDGANFTNFNLAPTLKDNTVLWITTDKQGLLWLGTSHTGIIKYDGQLFTNYSSVNGLANNEVRTITDDERGNLWFGTYGGGLSKFAGNSFTNFTLGQGLPGNVVFSIAEGTNGTLWLGTSGKGVSNYNGKTFINYTKADGLADNEIYSICKDHEGNLWFGTAGGGVTKYNGKTFTNFCTRQGLANNIVFSIAEDKKGNLWFGTSGGGVSKFDGKSFTNFTTRQGLAGNVLFNITQDKQDNLWFGTLGGGVSKFDGTSFINYTVKQGLSDDVIWDITEDKSGNLWLATQHGLSMMSSKNSHPNSAADSHNLFIVFSTTDGLPDNFITQVLQSSDDKLYIGTNLGACELLPVNGATGNAKGWLVGRRFNTRNGYPVKDVNAGLNALFQDSKGIIWMGTGSDKTGLVRFDPAALTKSNTLPPAIVINAVKLNNESICWKALDGDSSHGKDDHHVASISNAEVSTYGRELTNEERDSLRFKYRDIHYDSLTKWHPLPQQLVLPYYFNNIGFDFSAIETGKNFLVNYKYLLEGYDKDWSPSNTNTTVNFGNVGEGDYTFLVKAQSPDGVWSEPVSYHFKVLPPWWRTWWMFVVYTAAIIASILLFIRWKHKQIIYKQKILEHKVAIATKQVREENEKVQVQKRKVEETLKELKATQSQLIQSEKMASLGELTAGIAHEIQNPLNFVNNFSEVNMELLAEMNDEIAKGRYDDVKAIAADVIYNEEKINSHGKRADAIVKGMLQHSRSGGGEKESTDINKLTDEYLRLAYHGLKAKDKLFNAAFRTDYDVSIGNINVIPQDMGRVVLNLITNAFYAVDEKKKQLPTGYESMVVVSTKRLADKIELRVSDNGNGIPQPIVDKIFQPFFTTKPSGQGTGLGLSLAYDIVKTHGGELRVETKEGEGSAFIIQLPTAE